MSTPDASTTTSQASFRNLLAMLAFHKSALAVAIVLSLITSAIDLAQPLVVNEVIGSIGTGLDVRLVWLLSGMLLLSAVLLGVEMYILTCTAEAAVYHTRLQLIGRMIRLPISYFDSHRTGDLVTRLGSDTTLVRTAFTGGLVHAISGVVTMVGAITLMAFIDAAMLVIVLAVSVSVLVAVIMASRLIEQYTQKGQEAVGNLGADMDRALGAIRTVRSARAEDSIERELGDKAHEAYRMGVKTATVQGVLGPAASMAMQASFLIVLGVGGARVASGAISVGDLVSFVLYMFMVSLPLATIFDAITTIRQSMGALQKTPGGNHVRSFL